MLRDKAKSGRSTKQGKGKGVALVDSPTHVAPLTSAKDPPPYSAQHRQDALWEGGNEALPPWWHQFKVGDGETQYQDDNLVMVSWKRPLPGVRLDGPRQLIPGCEWHISPLGRSYFVNHNTRTTSWKKPVPDRPVRTLTPECIIEGHSECIWSLACVGTSCNIMSASEDGSIRQWIRDGEPVGEPWRSDGGGVGPMAVCPDETMVVSGSADRRLRLWNVKEGDVVGDPWEGHSAPVKCLDWSPNAREITSGSQDGTIRRWNPNTGRQIAPPIETGHGWVYAVKYSPRGNKFASCGSDGVIRVWSKDGKLLIEIKERIGLVWSLCWSKDGAYIFSGSGDCTIRKWQSIDGKELVVLRGHTNHVRSIYLSSDERHLVSASSDYSVRIWDLKTNQQVGDPLLHDDELLALAIPSDGRYIASAGLDKKIYLWSFEAALKQSGNQVRSDGNLKASKSDVDATRRRGDWRRNPYPGPSNDTPHHPHFAGRHILSPSSAHQQDISVHISSYQHAPPGRISLPPRRNNYNTEDIPTHPRFLQWARNPFLNMRNSQIDEGIKLQERRTKVVDAPLGQARPVSPFFPIRTFDSTYVMQRYYTARRVQMEKEKARNARVAEKQRAKEAKNASASSSRPSQPSVNPQPGEEAQTQPTLGSHSAGLSTSSTPATAAASAVTTRWARFWLAACCISAQNANDHH